MDLEIPVWIQRGEHADKIDVPITLTANDEQGGSHDFDIRIVLDEYHLDCLDEYHVEANDNDIAEHVFDACGSAMTVAIYVYVDAIQ